MKHPGLLAFGVLFLIATVGMSCSPVFVTQPFSHRVIDLETRQPIAGAYVIADWKLQRTMLHGAKDVGHLAVMETRTDANGMFTIPGLIRPNPWLGELLSYDPLVIVFAPGYEMTRYGSGSGYEWVPPIRRKRRSGDVTLRKLEDPVGPPLSKRHIHTEISIWLESLLKDCEWMSARRFFGALAAEDQALANEFPDAENDVSLEWMTRHTPLRCKLRPTQEGTNK